LLSLDAGTSSLKAVIYDRNGNLLAKASQGYPILYPRAGWAEQHPQEWWAACCAACRQLPEVHRSQVKCIGVSGQAPGCVPVNREGEPLRPAILWLDRRATQQVTWLREHVGLENAIQVGGNTLDSYYGGVKWLWFRQNEPEVYDNTWKILQVNSYLILKLTGEAVTDWGHAGICSPCFNLAERKWDETICSKMGLDLDKLPVVHSPAKVIGVITHAASQAACLPPGVPVICGAPDYVCSCLGSGAHDPGSLSLMLGTAGNLMIPSAPKADPRMLNTVHVDGSLISCGGVLAGAVVNWFGDMLGLDIPDLYALLDREAACIPAGSQELLFLPYLMGERSPFWDANARGVYFGLASTHSRAHLYRAALEGVAFAFRLLLDVAKNSGINPYEIIAINGGARSALWRQILADVLELPIRWRPEKDGTTLGGAILAAMGAGFISSRAEVSPWLESTIDTLPDKAHMPTYRHLYSIYAGLYDRLKDSFSSLQSRRLPD